MRQRFEQQMNLRTVAVHISVILTPQFGDTDPSSFSLL
jgi:hypothetical protein